MNPFTDIPADQLLGMALLVYIVAVAVCLWLSMSGEPKEFERKEPPLLLTPKMRARIKVVYDDGHYASYFNTKHYWFERVDGRMHFVAKRKDGEIFNMAVDDCNEIKIEPIKETE